MPRLMSVQLTEQAVIDRLKTATRRLGWWTDRNGRRLVVPGDRLTLCRKVMGRKHADGTVEPLVRLCDVDVIDVSRQQLHIANTPDEAAREGFPDWTWPEFVEFFCREMRCKPDKVVTRIEWRYLDSPCSTCHNQFSGQMPGHFYGSNWDWVPCQTCSGRGVVDLDNCDGPETCMDDLCRHADRGLCGKWRSEEPDDADDDYYYSADGTEP